MLYILYWLIFAMNNRGTTYFNFASFSLFGCVQIVDVALLPLIRVESTDTVSSSNITKVWSKQGSWHNTRKFPIPLALSCVAPTLSL